ncbi:MAG: hypothetical protein VKK04_02195 [Synechococcales bacterium]|nr:hypothetical protein [Synechococcales bacterium]
MAQRLKRWESPRKEGRNVKGKGGSARGRQRRKQTQMLKQKLKSGPPAPRDTRSPQAGQSPNSISPHREEPPPLFPIFLELTQNFI